ncbi:MAG TPA: HAD-IA family hydrolase [Luteimonas sp.]|nr:HAD-IA family hydrolase [Luteimonas sp.]HRP71974.1 HAD-IA family hydrolase [Luteimonas sp.]
MKPRIARILFDFDQVLAPYRHEKRIAALATYAGCAHERVREVLFTSGLEAEYDSGAMDTATYLDRLGAGIGRAVDEEAWIASRMAGSVTEAAMLERVAALDASLALGVLSNNGVLMARAIPRIIAPVAHRFEGRVLCSGALRVRKPDPAVFALALERLGWEATGTLFVDDAFANVQAARRIGLHAETVTDARSLGRVLRRYVLR